MPDFCDQRIAADQRILCGKPVVIGTRLSVELIQRLLEQGWDAEQILESYPGLTLPDIAACQSYPSQTTHHD